MRLEKVAPAAQTPPGRPPLTTSPTRELVLSLVPWPTPGGGVMIADHHLDMLAASGITPEHAAARGYETITVRRRLEELKFVKAACKCVPGLLIPMLVPTAPPGATSTGPISRAGSATGRSSTRRRISSATGWTSRPAWRPVGDPSVPLWVTEGVKKADCGAHYQMCVIAVSGVWNWRGTNDMGGKTAVADWNEIALNGRRVILAFDGDVARKNSAAKALCALADYLKSRGAKSSTCTCPTPTRRPGWTTT